MLKLATSVKQKACPSGHSYELRKKIGFQQFVVRVMLDLYYAHACVLRFVEQLADYSESPNSRDVRPDCISV